jgi:hypothetical protein
VAVLWQKRHIAAAPGTMHVLPLTALVAADVRIQLQTVLLLLIGGCCTALHNSRVTLYIKGGLLRDEINSAAEIIFPFLRLNPGPRDKDY